MPTELVGKSVVIVAQQLNPSIFSQLWLVKHHVFAEEEFVANCLFSDAFVQAMGNRFSLIVFPQQLQMVPQGNASDEGELVAEKISSIATLLPETPYTALGLNFVWNVSTGDESIHHSSRRLFYREGDPLYEHFRSEDSLFGAYMSKDFLGSRMRLDIKPKVPPETSEQLFQFSFNFHLDLQQQPNRVEAILNMIRNWNIAKEEASWMANLIRNEGTHARD